MLPAEIIVETVAAVGAVLTAVFGGGLLRQYISHSNQMAVHKHDLEHTKSKVEKNDLSIQDLKTTVALQDRDIENFGNSLKKLEMLPEINSRLAALEGIMKLLVARLDHDKHN